MRSTRFGTTLYMAAALSALAAPQAGHAQNVRGFVFGEESSAPMSGVLIRLMSRELDELETITTDILGRFTFQADGPERYVIVAEKDGYVSAPQVIEVGPIALATVSVTVSMRSLGTTKEEALGDERIAHLRGQIVVASSGDPVEGATVVLEADGRQVLTRWDGRFEIGDLQPGVHRIVIDHVAYTGRTWSFEADPGSAYDVRIPVQEEAIPIEGIEVTVRSRAVARKLEPVFERMERGLGGFYMTVLDFKSRGYGPVGMMIRALPSVSVIGTGLASSVRMRRGASLMQAGCSPEIWVDGVRATRDGNRAGEFLGMSTLDVEVIEVFPSPSSIPPEYNAGTLCAIGIWTKRGG